MSYASDLETNGYFVVPEILGTSTCAGLLREIIQGFHDSPITVIKEPDFRRHTPLPLSPMVSDALTIAVEHGYDVVSDFLKNEQDLVELSSITVFPNAKEQPLHRDEANDGHFLLSVFINLAETSEPVGALTVIPGSHHLDRGGVGAPIALELPQGSAVFMNSKLLHNGTSNTSTDRIRSVFYFSLGEPNLYGPPYSILDTVRSEKLSLNQLMPRSGQRRVGWNQSSRPQMSPNCRILLPLSQDENQEEILLCNGDTICHRLTLADDEEFLLDVLQRIECHPRELEVSDLAELSSQSVEVLISHLTVLARDGWIRH